MSTNNFSPNDEDFSQIDIDMDIVAQIAGRAALEVDGVLGVEGGMHAGLAAALRGDGAAPGIRVHLDDNELIIEVSAVTKFGMRIPVVAWNLQEHIKKSVEDNVGIAVQKVNVLISGVKMPKEEP